MANIFFKTHTISVGDETSTCQEDGTIASVPVCTAVQDIEFKIPKNVTPNQQGLVNLQCETTDKSFNAKADIKFYFEADDGTRENIPGK